MIVEYIWIDHKGEPRSKTRVISNSSDKEKKDVEVPLWNFDGSSTGQASGNNSEIILRPIAAYPDPFRGNDCIMALCETLNTDMTPHPSNTRHAANEIFKKYNDCEPLFGLEQEFFLFKNGKNLAFSDDNNKPAPQGNYYCGLGQYSHGRNVIEAAFKRCIVAGLTVTGFNAEVAPSQWEIQICANGVNAADQLIMLRYILNRTAEMFSISINYQDPSPLMRVNEKDSDGCCDWNGSGCHVNFSTNKMRERNGYSVITSMIDKLENKHSEHMKIYGEGNDLRMTGKNETSSYDTFTYGVADRTASIRIPQETFNNKSGYLEDRRPASNMNPYLVTSKILQTCME